MKFLNIKYLYILAFSLVVMSSCQKADIIAPDIDKVKKTALNTGLEPIQINGNAYVTPSLPFTISGYTIEEEIIWMPIQYVGYSDFADFMLTTDGNVHNINGEYTINVKLVRKNGNLVKKLSNKNLAFSLTPLHSYCPNPIILDIEGLGKISYSF